ncbi:MAG: hypothetical protein ACJA0K_000670 [Maricaulis maris]|jgi:hypothetical protein
MRSLSHQDRVAAFKAATRSLIHWYGDELAEGVTDDRLTELLAKALGLFGGSGGPGSLSLTYQGAGLKIWASWTGHNHVTDKPVFQGKATIAMAREIYGIKDPANTQLDMFR